MISKDQYFCVRVPQKPVLGCWPEGQNARATPSVVVRLHSEYSLLVVRGRLLRKREGFWRSRACGGRPGRCKWQERLRGK